ncbi:hypothetical protein TTHERM_01054360 (macronuclear) [Tetrahymena thermophila SB210]|uniref:Uncharacterized protein n=1 Tax=Tetrahymena thermophila (strain SB210) TaxID=312017 RepID=Q22CB5_TETTS|nr:hypothetical protein TTHERM_01054360 [Tetrahymena thermophila SB210]EAR82951.2 hypothetical protein TTHERM_01054360 [Tetrahymena thermophila SB210]|eukprot:XP_001030614.2 hypothetical protein TTHERM_01054360 [Tetrahymena thermophila SB210]
MNNYTYQIYFYKLQDGHNFAFDLRALDLNDKIADFNHFFSNTEEQFEVEVILGSGIGQLVDKSTFLDDSYDRIRYNLSFVMNYVKNSFGLQMVSVFKFQNLDCLLNIEDILFQLIRDQQQLKELSISSRKELSSLLFNSLLESISFNRETLEKLNLVFSVKDDLTEIQIPSQLSSIKHLSLSNLSSKVQSNVFKIAKSIEEIDISNSYSSRLSTETIVDGLHVTKNSLQKLHLALEINNHLSSKNCLKQIEKLQNLRSLFIQTVNLKNENLDIQKLKKLEKLSLIFSDAIDYLSNHSNLNQIQELEIVVGMCDASKLKVNNLKNLRNLHIQVKQAFQKETKNTISCLEKFCQIAHQLDEFKLNFSESSFFKVSIMNQSLIESIGQIFEKSKRFELAQAFMKIKNYQDFTLNNLCLYEELQHENKKFGFVFDLRALDLNDKITAFNHFFSNTEEQFEVEVTLGSGVGQLVDKSTLLDDSYDRIRQNLMFVMNYVKDSFGLQRISVFTFMNLDCLFNIEDILFQLIRDQQYLEELSISSRKDLSSVLFNQLLESICFNRERLEKLNLKFSVKDDITETHIPNKLSSIKHLSLSYLTSKVQLNVFKIAKSIEEIEISNSYNSRLSIEAIVDGLHVTKNSLQKLHLALEINNHLLTKNCLKPIEKLQNLRSLHIETVNLKNQNLDIQKLKKLEKLSLIFSDAIDYLSNHSNLNQIQELEIVVGMCDASKLKVSNLKNLRNLHIVVKQISQKETKNTISCIEKFCQIAHQLDELKLDFSESSFFKINIMNQILIESIGLIFEKCNEETKVSFINRNCSFNTAKRFELAQAFMKVKNYQDFTLNDVCIYQELQHENEISSYVLQNKFPYYLSLSSLCQNLTEKKVVDFDWNYLNENYSLLKNLKSFFSKFKKFSISQMPYYRYVDKTSENFIQILPEEVTFIKLSKQFSLKRLIKNSKNFKQLKQIQFEETEIDRYDTQISSLKEAFNQNLYLKFTHIFTHYSYENQYQKLFELQNYIIEIKINSSFSQKDITELFDLILNQKNIIYLNLEHAYDYQISYDDFLEGKQSIDKYTHLITNYSNNVQIQVLTISAFNNHFIEFINLNPKLLYLDLYY